MILRVTSSEVEKLVVDGSLDSAELSIELDTEKISLLVKNKEADLSTAIVAVEALGSQRIIVAEVEDLTPIIKGFILDGEVIDEEPVIYIVIDPEKESLFIGREEVIQYLEFMDLDNENELDQFFKLKDSVEFDEDEIVYAIINNLTLGDVKALVVSEGKAERFEKLLKQHNLYDTIGIYEI